MGVRPSGWEHAKNAAKDILKVAYSEHSSYDELENFVKQVKAKKILSTVRNGEWVEEWLSKAAL